jgi:hypothetical protein
MEKISFFLFRPPLWYEKSKNLKMKKGSMFFDIHFLKEEVYFIKNFGLFSRVICLMEAMPPNVTHRFKGMDAVLKRQSVLKSNNSVPLFIFIAFLDVLEFN